MAFDFSEGIQQVLNGVLPNRTSDATLSSQSGVEGIIRTPRFGEFGRRMLHWRVPHIGWVKMSLNPTQMVVTEGKDVSDTRTKAGFILQYAGEKMTQISIQGTTGSGGIEGINILREVYRAEQHAFDRIALEMERTGPLAETLQITKGLFDGIASSTEGFFGDAASLISDVTQGALNTVGQSFPTLASLAVNVELYFQGELFRGYFKDFVVTESSDQPGIFEYSILFMAHSRQGIRRNFMPWHRQPYNPIGLANNDANPLSFISEQAAPDRSSPLESTLNTRTESEPLPSSIIGFAKGGNNKRSLATGSGRKGQSLTDIDLEDLV